MCSCPLITVSLLPSYSQPRLLVGLWLLHLVSSSSKRFPRNFGSASAAAVMLYFVYLCFLVTHVSEIGRKTDGTLLSYFCHQLWWNMITQPTNNRLLNWLVTNFVSVTSINHCNPPCKSRLSHNRVKISQCLWRHVVRLPERVFLIYLSRWKLHFFSHIKIKFEYWNLFWQPYWMPPQS